MGHRIACFLLHFCFALADHSVDPLFDRASNVVRPGRTDLDSATLGKTAQLAAQTRLSMTPPTAAFLPRRGEVKAAAVASPKKLSVQKGTFKQTVANRYAAALYDASEDKLDKIHRDLNGLQEMMDASKDLKQMIESDYMKKDMKIAVLKDLQKKMGADAVVGNFLGVLADRNRLGSLAKMIEEFNDIYTAGKGSVPCVVTSAIPLDEDELAEMKKALEAKVDMKLIMQSTVDPALIAGWKIRMGDWEVDESVASKLEALKKIDLKA